MVALLLAGGDAHAKTRYYIGCDPFNLGMASLFLLAHCWPL